MIEKNCQLKANLLNDLGSLSFQFERGILQKAEIVLLFTEICSSEFLMVQVTSFLEISEVIGLLNLSKYLKSCFEIEDIQLRILKSKAHYYEKRKMKPYLFDVSFLPLLPKEQKFFSENSNIPQMIWGKNIKSQNLLGSFQKVKRKIIPFRIKIQNQENKIKKPSQLYQKPKKIRRPKLSYLEKVKRDIEFEKIARFKKKCRQKAFESRYVVLRQKQQMLDQQKITILQKVKNIIQKVL